MDENVASARGAEEENLEWSRSKRCLPSLPALKAEDTQLHPTSDSGAESSMSEAAAYSSLLETQQLVN